MEGQQESRGRATEKNKEERQEVMGRAGKAGRNVGEEQIREERQEEK